MGNTIDKNFLLHEIQERIKGLELRANKFRKSKDGHQLHKIKARKDELERLKNFIENGLFDEEESE